MNYLNQLLIFLSVRPYKTVELPTGLIVDHFRDGKLIANKRNVKTYDKR